MVFATEPEKWSSAHRPIRYVVSFDRNFGIIVDDGSSGLRIDFAAQARVQGKVGDLIYVKEGIYKGLHTITSIIIYNVAFKITGTYTAVSTFDNAHILYVPLFVLYKGHQSTDPYPVQLPFAELATFIPEYVFDTPSDQYVVKIDISGYLKSIFDIQPPVLDGIDFNMFNQFQLQIQIPDDRFAFGTQIDYSLKRNVANSAIKSSVLNSEYNHTDTYLSDEGTLPYLFTCGRSIFSILEEEFIRNESFSPDIPLDCHFFDDFNNDFLIC